MIEILKAWYLFSFSFGCWTGLHLLLNRRGDKQIKRTMAIFIVLLLLPALSSYVALARQAPVPWLSNLSHTLTWAYGPLIWLLAQQVLLRPTAARSVVLHGVPFVLINVLSQFELSQTVDLALVGLLFIQILLYLGASTRLMVNNRDKLRQLRRHHKNTTYYWMLYLLGGLLFATLMDITIYAGLLLQLFPISQIFTIIACMLAAYVNAIALFALYQPEIFMHAEGTTAAQTEAEPIEVKPACRMVELSPQAAKELDEQLMRLVTEHQPHLDDSISLGKLASLLGVTTHQLSELLNIHKEMSFYEFLNDLRFQESVKLLAKQDEELTIADIAYRSGFNNRNSFYKVFKEKTGVTPTQYKKQSA